MRFPSSLAAMAVLVLASCQSTGHHVEDGDAEHGPVSAATYAHDVYFVLSDASRVDGLVAACNTLRDLPGVVHLTVGRRDPEQARDVNEQTFQVALHVEFDSVDSYALYGPHPVHQALVTEFGPDFDTVVVYDSVLDR